MAEIANIQFIPDEDGKKARYRDADSGLESSTYSGRASTYYATNTFLTGTTASTNTYRFHLANFVPGTLMTIEKFFMNQTSESSTIAQNTILDFRKTSGFPTKTVGSGTHTRIDSDSTLYNTAVGPQMYVDNAASSNVPTQQSLIWNTAIRIFQVTPDATMGEWIFNQQANLIPASYRLTNLSLRNGEGVSIFQTTATSIAFPLNITVVYTMEGE